MKLFFWQLFRTFGCKGTFIFLLFTNLVATGVKPATASPQSPFKDVHGHWAQLCIQQLAQQGIITGYPDGLFRPDVPVTRAEFATITSNAFGSVGTLRTADSDYLDVPENYWAEPAIDNAYQTNFLIGYPDLTFQPTKSIPRVEVLVSLVSGLNYLPEIPLGTPPELELELEMAAMRTLTQSLFDVDSIPRYAYRAIAIALENNLIVNYPQTNRLQPNKLANRGEVAAFVCQARNIPGGVSKQYVVNPTY